MTAQQLHLNVPPLAIQPLTHVPARREREYERDYDRVIRIVYDGIPFHVAFDWVSQDNDPAERNCKWVCMDVLLRLDEKMVVVGPVLDEKVGDVLEKLGLEVIHDEESEERMEAALRRDDWEDAEWRF
jgi:hypothetical protein